MPRLAALALLLATPALLQADDFKTAPSKIPYQLTGQKSGRGVLFVWHGAGGTPAQARRLFGRGGSAELMVVSTNNKHADRGMRVIPEILDDICGRGIQIDWGRIHVAGVSAGANISMFAANAHPELIAGVGFFQGGGPITNRREGVAMPAVFMSVGTRDPNFPIAAMRQSAERCKAAGCEVTLREHGGAHMPVNAKHVGEWVSWLKTQRKPFAPGRSATLPWQAVTPAGASELPEGKLILLYLYRAKRDARNRALQHLEMTTLRDGDVKSALAEVVCVKADSETDTGWNSQHRLPSTSGLLLLRRLPDGKLEKLKTLSTRTTPQALIKAIERAAR